MQTFGIREKALNCDNLVLMNPLGYHELLRLNMGTLIMLTDSGGLQEECCPMSDP